MYLHILYICVFLCLCLYNSYFMVHKNLYNRFIALFFFSVMIGEETNIKDGKHCKTTVNRVFYSGYKTILI